MTATTTPVFDFSAQQITPETTREYVFDMIPGTPGIVLAPAHDSNPAYLDARLRASIEASEKLTRNRSKKPEKTTPELLKKQIEEDRDADRHLIAEACARGWTTAPKAVDGSAPEFSAENCYAFLKALPAYMFDPFRNFAQNLYNFVDQPEIDEGEADQLGN